MFQVAQVCVHHGPPIQRQVGQLVQAPNRTENLACSSECTAGEYAECQGQVLKRLQGVQAPQTPSVAGSIGSIVIYLQPSACRPHVSPVKWLSLLMICSSPSETPGGTSKQPMMRRLSSRGCLSMNSWPSGSSAAPMAMLRCWSRMSGIKDEIRSLHFSSGDASVRSRCSSSCSRLGHLWPMSLTWADALGDALADTSAGAQPDWLPRSSHG